MIQNELILKLKAPVKDYIWGGTRLRDFGRVGERIAESWELSCHPDGLSIIEGSNVTLLDYLKAHPEAAGEQVSGAFPIMVKLIDARDKLSLQVHPDDEYAMAHEGERGKNELWYVVDCEPGSYVIYGFKQAVSETELRRAVADNTVLDYVNIIPVKKGDVFMIPAGMLHAIGEGCLIAEIQQSSNITYRVYDHGRPRELHIDKALDVIRRDAVDVPKQNRSGALLADNPYFKVYAEDVNKCSDEKYTKDSFTHLLILDGKGTVFGSREDVSEKMPLKKGDSFFIPAGVKWRIDGQCSIVYTVL